MNNYYVYLHTRLTDSIVFYVGQGYGKRAWATSRRNIYWQRTVEKYGYIISFAYENLTKQEAASKEIELISHYKQISGGALTNMTGGGDGGMLGYKHTEEAKAKIGAAAKGNTWGLANLDRTGIPNSEKTRQKIREKRKLQINTRKGVPQSDETKEKLRQANLGKTYSQETNLKKGLVNKGKPRDPELVAKTAASNKGKTRTPEQKEKMRLAQLKVPRKGKPMSQEARNNMSIAAKNRKIKICDE